MTDAISTALSAYQQTAKRIMNASADNVDNVQERESPAGTFAQMLKDTAKQAEADQRYGELMSMKAIKGTADMQEVVMAVSNAEMALQTVVAVRDKVVSAYQEILQMPI